MTHQVSANYTLPTILDTLKPAGGSGAAKAASTTSGTSSGTAVTGLGSTFLSLLTKELQNQDPTAPMDSTAMVGQMISLNQLDQLISINQKTSTPPAAGATKGVVPAAPANASASGILAAMNAAMPMLPSAISPSAAAAAQKSQLPYFDPSMAAPLLANPSRNGSGSTDLLNSPINAATLGFPGFDNTSGGK